MKRVKKKAINSQFEDAMLLNSRTYIDYLERMKKIALSMFEWVNLPDSMNSRYLEMCLYYKGQAALLYDENFGFINTQAADSGYINIYGLPTKINCYSYSYNQIRDLYVPDATGQEKTDECILVMNTYERIPTCATVELFAMRLAEAQRTADININAMRTPVLIKTDKNQELSLRNLYAQYEGNTPVIFADRTQLNPDDIKVFKTDAPFIARDIMDYKVQIWNEFLTTLGVSNLDEKRERLITSEIDSNNELVNLNLQSFLAPRKKACEEFNDKYGLAGEKAIDVKVRSDLYNIIKQAESITDEYRDLLRTDKTVNEGEDDGTLYD
ncbi:MAG: hypothetical protein J6S67_02170 [Methanobrevibacter sp.]|nr:hypothetical protein [Methanobrevibacter sp.]